MRLYFFRHGETVSNRERKYLGRTDEALTAEGARRIGEIRAPRVARVFASPLLRCAETAKILYPGRRIHFVPGFVETDFGAFELKSHEELQDDFAYRAWLDTLCASAPPGGESRDAVAARCLNAFYNDVLPGLSGDAACIAHGGTIMALLSRLSVPPRSYYDYLLPNGGCFAADWDGEALRDPERL